MDKNFIGQRISALLIENKISERKLSSFLGHADGYINKITTGKMRLSVDELINICDFFHITPSQFFADTEASPTSVTIISELHGLSEAELQFIKNTIQFIKKNRNL